MHVRPLEGKTAFVTGGSRGIGAAIVRGLALQGATVTFTYVAAGGAADALVDDIRLAGGHAEAVRADSADAEGLAQAIDVAAAAHGRLDILVNNAGVITHGPVDDLPVEEFDRVFAINVRAVYAGTRAAAKHMGEGGSVITVGSIVADRSGFPGTAIYSASKGAIKSMTRGFARDLGPRGITVNNVQPGPIATDMNPAYVEELVLPLIPLGRMGRAEEVAALVAHLAGPEARFTTGASFTVDGGFMS
ncbi:MAG TPA: 3-oxoacyl-ACP reductase family protein [Luteibacter sp.]|uniref:3-oxoacyl-ACP reductase family protein n=1 Tax=Luteibacter sp. TaxID=1886636 RepID=UPI002B709924|nr:3-oxoacyl-ACP reductase family protein [Luteibacter sp.]HVI55795.1 3-oxoacyl-ACP reductase family protein [Luteibacter sp.]